MHENLTEYRIRSGEGNASARSVNKTGRSYWEVAKVYRRYLKIKDFYEFKKIFPEIEEFYSEALIEKHFKEILPFLLAKIAVEKIGTIFHLMFAIEILYEILSDDKIANILEEKFNFGYVDFIKITGLYANLFFWPYFKDFNSNEISKEEKEKISSKKKGIFKKLVNFFFPLNTKRRKMLSKFYFKILKKKKY